MQAPELAMAVPEPVVNLHQPQARSLEDLEEWLDQFKRVAVFNWEDARKVSHIFFPPWEAQQGRGMKIIKLS